MSPVGKRVLIMFGLVALAGLFGVVNEMTYQDEIQAENFYCQDVQAGIYPNYKNLNCGE